MCVHKRVHNTLRWVVALRRPWHVRTGAKRGKDAATFQGRAIADTLFHPPHHLRAGSLQLPLPARVLVITAALVVLGRGYATFLVDWCSLKLRAIAS